MNDPSRVLIAALALFSAPCISEERDCPEFDEAQQLLNDLADQTLDPEFKDPAFVAAAERFEAIPSTCKRHQQAVTMAQSIRTAQDTRQADEARASKRQSELDKARRAGASVGPSEDNCLKGVFCTVKSTSGNVIYKTFCMGGLKRFEVKLALSKCTMWVTRSGPPGRTVQCLCQAVN